MSLNISPLKIKQILKLNNNYTTTSEADVWHSGQTGAWEVQRRVVTKETKTLTCLRHAWLSLTSAIIFVSFRMFYLCLSDTVRCLLYKHGATNSEPYHLALTTPGNEGYLTVQTTKFSWPTLVTTWQYCTYKDQRTRWIQRVNTDTVLTTPSPRRTSNSITVETRVERT